MNFSAKPPYSTPFNLKLIPFVSPSPEKHEITSSRKFKLDTGLSGKEASDFYNNVISSSSVQSTHRAKNVQKTRNSPSKIASKQGGTKYSNKCLDANAMLHFAQDGDIKGLQYCVAAGCSVNDQDNYGWTPIMCSAYEGHFDCVKYLVECKANIHLKCKQGMSASDLAKKSNHLSIVKFLRNENSLDKHSLEKVVDPQTTVNNKKFCNQCQITYVSSFQEHSKSIAHLLSTKNSDLSTYYHIPESNKGYQLMLRSGWNKEKGLGLNADGRKFPIKTVLKKDRSCIGQKKEVAKITHFSACDISSIKLNKPNFLKVIREKTLNKRRRKKLDCINRQKEIEFRRQFNSEY